MQNRPGVHVSLEQIYAKLLEVAGDVTEVKAKLNELSVTSEDHEERLRKVEKTVWTRYGFAGSIGGVIGGVLTHISKIFN